LKAALRKCFEDEPSRIFGIQDLCSAVQRYYFFSNFQKQLDPKHPQRRYEHEVRSLVNKLKAEHVIVHLARNQYKLG
jgi:hypothetical protein